MDCKQSEKDLYEIIGVVHNSGHKDIKKSYRAKLLKCFPDKLPLDATEEERLQAKNEFLRLEEAWSILSDSSKRKEYDAYLKAEKLERKTPSTGTIDLSEMDFDQDEGIYYYPCRCGGEFTLDEVTPPSSVTVCDTCSLSLTVLPSLEKRGDSEDRGHLEKDDHSEQVAEMGHSKNLELIDER